MRYYHRFGTIDWLCRAAGPAYINRVFAGRPAIGPFAKLRLELIRKTLLAVQRLIAGKSLDLTQKRNPFRQTAVVVVKHIAVVADHLLVWLSSLEWRFLKRREHGTAQYLVFHKR
jgi:hypothetical protein